jgi:hypothetical protein
MTRRCDTMPRSGLTIWPVGLTMPTRGHTFRYTCVQADPRCDRRDPVGVGFHGRIDRRDALILL